MRIIFKTQNLNTKNMGIQFKEANELEAKWEERKRENPDLVCNHPKGFTKEYYLSAGTGDYVCPVCGEVLTAKEYKEWENRNIE